jgi:uncharacterized membrane protein (UPF0127 family)
MVYGILSILVATVLLALLGYLVVSRRSSGLPEVTVSFGDTHIRAEIAGSTLSRARGLSYRDELLDGRGMLFTFGAASRHTFWMKGMNFSIDIVWLRNDKVVDITPNVDPQRGAMMTLLKTYSPKVPADDVLELPAGYAAAHNIRVGDLMVVTR